MYKNSKRQTIFSSIQPIDRALSGATTPGQSGPESDGNEGVLRIPQSSSIAGTSPSDCLMSYPGHSLGGGSYPSAEKQSVYSTAPADLVQGSIYYVNVGKLTKCRVKPDYSSISIFSSSIWVIIIIIIIIIIMSFKFFTSALADGFSLKSEWQQVSSSLQDCSQYSDRSQ